MLCSFTPGALLIISSLLTLEQPPEQQLPPLPLVPPEPPFGPLFIGPLPPLAPLLPPLDPLVGLLPPLPPLEAFIAPPLLLLTFDVAGVSAGTADAE
jgi:hypothetical protein